MEAVEFDVVGLGYSCIDDLLLLTEIPVPEGRATIRRRERQGGGMAATALVAVARLGGRAGFIAKVGDDAIGAQVLADFRRYGVDVSRSVTQPGATSHLTVVLVDGTSGARAFLSQRGTVRELRPDEVDRDYVASAAVLLLSDATPAAVQAARWAKAAGRQVSFDGTHFHPSFFGLVEHVDYAIVSRFFASELVAHREGRDVGRAARDFAALALEDDRAAAGAGTAGATHGLPPRPLGPLEHAVSDEAPVHHGAGAGPLLAGEQLLDAAERLRRPGPAVAAVTEGERGCWCVAPEGRFHVPAFS